MDVGRCHTIGGRLIHEHKGRKITLTLNLDKALEIALSDNPTIKVAGQEILLKKEARREAYAGLFPEASLVGSYSRAIKKQSFAMMGEVIEVGTDNTYSGGLSVSLPVFAPALYKSISLTSTDVNLAVEKSRASRLDMVNQVTKAFFQLLLAQDSYEVLLKSYKQSEDNYNVVKATPFKRDIVKELAAACAKHGIKLHFYYSHLDWVREDYPWGRTGRGTGRPDSKGTGKAIINL